ncbi:ATP-binding protein [Flavobacterium sp. FBOR7N2.3]|uniref:ATP-binding protein n=1 Tax=Flavobacterium magnesitis TaxID=3138077 RepID=A0ABV4TQ63_9FLAO
MIVYFKVGNYKSINEPITLNFNASSISEHSESNLIENEKTVLLKSMLLYGHNASGKSKILDAIDYFKWFINNSATEKQSADEIDVEPFRLLESSSKKPSFFEMSFIIGKTTFRYGFEADDKKVHKEWLLETKIKKETPVFLRINQEIDVDYKKFENSDNLEKRTRKNALFLSVASQWNVKKAELIDQWFDSIFNIHGMDDRDYRDITIGLLNNEKYSNMIRKFIQKADLGISKIDIIDVPFTFDEIKDSIPENMRDRIRANFEKKKTTALISGHNKYNDNNEVIGIEHFVFDKSESEGTMKYFNLIGLLITAILENRVVIIDEFDARLHSLLSKAIIKLFNSSKIKTKAQLLVATHDTALIDRDLLRRDQIYFIEKDFRGASKATSLVEFKPRKESPYDKNYLDGKYGGIPFINDLESLFSDGEKE